MTKADKAATPKAPIAPIALAMPAPAAVSVLNRRRRSSILLGTALGAVLGMGYGRGAYGQVVISEDQTTPQLVTGPEAVIVNDGVSVYTATSNAIVVTASGATSGDIVV